jgi:hypothetical protein
VFNVIRPLQLSYISSATLYNGFSLAPSSLSLVPRLFVVQKTVDLSLLELQTRAAVVKK